MKWDSVSYGDENLSWIFYKIWKSFHFVVVNRRKNVPKKLIRISFERKNDGNLFPGHSKRRQINLNIFKLQNLCIIDLKKGERKLILGFNLNYAIEMTALSFTPTT